MKTITPKKCKDEKAIVVCEHFIGERGVELNPKEWQSLRSQKWDHKKEGSVWS